MAMEYVDLATARFFPDCLAVRNLARAGMKRATAARQVNARVWCVTFMRSGGGIPTLEWVPAHLSEEMVGHATIGDGTLLMHEHWAMNELVDK